MKRSGAQLDVVRRQKEELIEEVKVRLSPLVFSCPRVSPRVCALVPLFGRFAA